MRNSQVISASAEIRQM